MNPPVDLDTSAVMFSAQTEPIVQVTGFRPDIEEIDDLFTF
jgi:hypothetical protein